MRLRRAHAEFLGLQRVVRVATASRRGTPHVVPVCAVVRDGRLYFASGATARKVRNLAENPTVAIVADEYSEAWTGLRGVLVTGTARVHHRGPRWRLARRLLYAKYPQYPRDAALAEGDAVVAEVTPTRVFTWGFE